MRIPAKFSALVLVALALTQGAHGGEFVNLRFDEPDQTQFFGEGRETYAPIDAAFRGWTLQWDYELEPMYYLLQRGVGVENGDAPVGLIHSFPGSQGEYEYGAYRAVINSLWAAPGPRRPPLHLFQIGTVPADAQSLQMYWFVGGMGDYGRVLVNGQEQTLGPSNRPWSNWGALDVSPYAGQEIKLEFVFPAGRHDYYEFDIGGFTAVPEPGVWALLGLGGAALLGGRRRAFRSGRSQGS
jgi:hypothetical protein